MRSRGEVRARLTNVVTGLLVAVAASATCRSAQAECGNAALDGDSEQCDVADERVAESCSEDCRFTCTTTLNDEITDHTCGHVTFGPFQALGSLPYGATVEPPALAQGHYFYTVSMATNEAGDVVDSFVRLSSPYRETALYLNESDPVTVVDDRGETVAPIFQAPVATCAAGLERVHIYSTDITANYFVVFPAAGPRQRSVILENAGDANSFEYGYDGDRDGFGESRYSVRTWCSEQELRELGFVRNIDDCDDARPRVYPGATELCDELDNDCDGSPEASSDQCEPVPEPNETATSASTDRQTDAPPHSVDAGTSGATNDAGTQSGETTDGHTLTDVREPSSNGADAGAESMGSSVGETNRESRDGGGQQQSSNEDSSEPSSGPGDDGCGCAVIGGEGARGARGVGALLALLVLSCGVRRRVGAGLEIRDPRPM